MAETLESLGAKIDALSSPWSGRFEQGDEHFEQPDARFEQADGRVDHIEARFEQANLRFGQLDARLEQLDTRLEDGFAEVSVQLAEQRAYTEYGYARLEKAMTARFDRLERKIDQILAALPPPRPRRP